MIFLIKIKKVCLITTICMVVGCASLKAPLYPDVIYNDRQPLISVTYEYGEIQLILPLKYDGAVPKNILFKVYSQGDTTHPIISILQEAPKEFLAYLPQGVLDIRGKTNLIKIIPQDSNFDPLNVRFEGIQFGRILLPTKTIRIGQLIVSGYTRLNTNDSIISGIDISMQNFDNIIYQTSSNEFGYYQIAVPGEYRFADHLRLVAGDNLIFKPFKRKLDFQEKRKIQLDIAVGPSEEMKEPLYMTNKSNVHFRDGPDIGSETLFLLEQGEIIAVDRVTPGEYFGSIEVELDNAKNIKMEGWINRSDLRLVNMKNIYKLKQGD